jgi:hypothetical protein
VSDRPLKRASYVLHIATVAGLNSQDNSLLAHLAYVKLLDEVLDLFDTEPRFQHFVLDGEVRPLEVYLSIRPENFEQIEQYVKDGRLLIGPWYVQIDPLQSNSETAIRNLILGIQTAGVFGNPMRVGYLPKINKLPRYLPQILKGFDIEVAVTACIDDTQSTELLWVGDDGTQIALGQVRQGIVPIDTSIASIRTDVAPYADAGHLLLLYAWDMKHPHIERLELLNAIPATVNALHDSVFHSHPMAYAKAIQKYAEANSLPKIYSVSEQTSYSRAEWALTRVIEPLMTWAEALEALDGDRSIRRPQYLLQQLWKRYLSGEDEVELVEDCSQLAEKVLTDIANHIDTSQLADSSLVMFNPDYFSVEFQSEIVPALGFVVCSTSLPAPLSASREEELEGQIIVSTGIHEGSLPLSASLITASAPQFHITAAKLPEDPEHEGLIVRGHNIGDEDIWVTLTPWRPYEIIDVVTMNEEPTGGRLAQESNGAVRFKAAPHRILTLWFHD